MWRQKLTDMLVATRVNKLNGTETYDYRRGYEAGVSDSMALVGMFCAIATFIVVALFPSLYLRIRAAVKPWAEKEVERETSWVIAMQKYSHPILDQLFLLTSLTCGTSFYITFLPFLFWSGELRFARHLTILCAVLIYVGNSVKDIICSPRPNWKKGVRLVGGDSEHAMEYGLPSTHTINTVATVLYVLLFDWDEDGKPWDISSTTSLACVGWCIFIMYGRLYLGMHSPIDVALGLVVAIGCVVFYLPFSEYVDAWLLSDCQVPLYQSLFSLLLIKSYPTPLKHTPSYEYAVAFTGVVLGVVLGIWKSELHSNDAMIQTRVIRGEGYMSFIIFSATRFVPGLLLVLIARQVVKTIVGGIFSLISFPKWFDSKAIERLIVYATIGFTVVDPALRMFTAIGI